MTADTRATTDTERSQLLQPRGYQPMRSETFYVLHSGPLPSENRASSNFYNSASTVFDATIENAALFETNSHAIMRAVLGQFTGAVLCKVTISTVQGQRSLVIPFMGDTPFSGMVIKGRASLNYYGVNGPERFLDVQPARSQEQLHKLLNDWGSCGPLWGMTETPESKGYEVEEL